MKGCSSDGESSFSLVTRLGYKLVNAAKRFVPPYICAPATNTRVSRLKPRATSISTASSGVNGQSPCVLKASGDGSLKKIKKKKIRA